MDDEASLLSLFLSHSQFLHICRCLMFLLVVLSSLFSDYCLIGVVVVVVVLAVVAVVLVWSLFSTLKTNTQSAAAV